MHRAFALLFLALVAADDRTSAIALYGAVRNISSGAISFNCPIPNPSPDDCSMSVTAYVLDLTTTGRVSCTAYARSASAGSSSSTDYISKSSDTDDTLNFTGLGCDDNLVHMVCSVPAKSGSSYSGVVSYEVVTD